MDRPKKYSSRYVTVIYAMFLMLLAFTLSLFYLSRCQKPSRLTNQDDSVPISEDSSENITTEPDQILNAQKQSQNKIEPFKSNNVGDEPLDAQQAEKVFSNKKNSTITDLKTPSGEASSPSFTPVRPESGRTQSGQKVVIYFSTDSTGLTDDALEKLNMIHGFLLNRPDVELTIEGYGDSSTNNQINQKLSQFRAEIVKSYFVKQGISSSKIKVFWMGRDNLERELDPKEKEDKNHQVEIKFTSKSNSDLK